MDSFPSTIMSGGARRGGLVISLMLAMEIVPAMIACAADIPQWSGYAILRGSSEDEGPLGEETVLGEAHLGLDWTIAVPLELHVHFIGRSNHDDSERGRIGVTEAYFESNFHPGAARMRVRAGAMFLPTSRENVDALWESPYTISSSALNTWFGEELRPIGVDASYIDRSFMAGATLFRGNDTFGALPADRGWAMHDHWTLLGEWVPVDEDGDDYTSVSAENDGRLGWSARGGWSGDRLSLQYTHIDNRSDGLPYGELYNWGTKFDVASFEITGSDWVIAGEHGWGPTFLVVRGRTFVTDLRASYILVSKRFSNGRASIRVDSYRNRVSEDEALTIAYFRDGFGKWRAGVELLTTGDDTRVLLQLRYGFSSR